ncbi:hypothetical protein H312_02796 [Anncaliia algerae PRA339]|uniref:Uncharacterized protein n=1 Tax=Anncaliia algerae PRA339 TaxID=1288291 RepID=A0A059EYI5_9MICR|nr:hypothetical protein H312_02796 [Anncaliia algerae PRA339]
MILILLIKLCIITVKCSTEVEVRLDQSKGSSKYRLRSVSENDEGSFGSTYEKNGKRKCILCRSISLNGPSKSPRRNTTGSYDPCKRNENRSDIVAKWRSFLNFFKYINPRKRTISEGKNGKDTFLSTLKENEEEELEKIKSSSKLEYKIRENCCKEEGNPICNGRKSALFGLNSHHSDKLLIEDKHKIEVINQDKANEEIRNAPFSKYLKDQDFSPSRTSANSATLEDIKNLNKAPGVKRRRNPTDELPKLPTENYNFSSTTHPSLETSNQPATEINEEVESIHSSLFSQDLIRYFDVRINNLNENTAISVKKPGVFVEKQDNKIVEDSFAEYIDMGGNTNSTITTDNFKKQKISENPQTIESVNYENTRKDSISIHK